jgi:hypothetical protein
MHPTVRLILPTLAAVLVAGIVTQSAEKTGPQLAHMVFFTLKDHSKEARDAFVASCHKLLADHEGTVSFSVGVIAEDVVEPVVSVRDFDVALHVVFEDKAARDKYLEHPRHTQFVQENKEHFAKVRVFDSYLSAKAR